MLKSDVIASDLPINAEAEQALAKYNAFMAKSRPYKAVVRRSHKFADDLVKALDVPARSPCKAGCNACCSHGVELTAIEAAVIQNEYQVQAFGIVEDKVLLPPPHTKYDGIMCPFNKEGNCQIYDHRPIACRVFYSLEKTSANCYVADGGLQFNHRSSNVFADVTTMLAMGTNIKGMMDIRDFFGTEPIEL